MVNFKNITLGLISLGFLYASALQGQSITDVQPDEARLGESMTVTITGQNVNFKQGSGTSLVIKDGDNDTDKLYSNSHKTTIGNKLEGSFNFIHYLDTGLYDIKYEDENTGIVASKNDAFEIKADSDPPSIKDVDPNIGQAGNTVSVTLTAKNFTFSQGTSSASIHLVDNNGDIEHSQSTRSFLSNTEVQGSISLSQNFEGGFYDIAYYNFNRKKWVEKTNGFFVKTPNNALPQISDVKQDTITMGPSENVKITTTSGDLYETPTDSIYLVNDNEKIAAHKVRILGEKELVGKFDVKTSFESGFYDVMVKYAGSFELLENDALYVKESGYSSRNLDQKEALNVKTFPNPAQNNLNVNLDLSKPMKIRGDLVSVSGKEILTLFDQNMNAGKNEIRNINVSNFKPGSYFLKLSSSSDDNFKRMIQFQKQ